MIIVMVNSEKGGVGKTSLSHAICFGAALTEDVDFPIALGHTDQREPVVPESQGYEIIDMRDPDTGVKILKEMLKKDFPGLFVIDTGANMRDYSSLLMRSVDMVVIPVAHDYDAVRMAKEVGSHYPERSFFVLNQAPSKMAPEFKRFKKKVIDQFDEDRILMNFPQNRTVAEFSSPDELDSYARSRLRAPSVKLWESIKELIEE